MSSPTIFHLPFFVYGTLLPGQPNHYLWSGTGSREDPATLDRGCLYDMGPYPMLVAGGCGRVQGLVVTVKSDRYQIALSRLDNLEGYDPDCPNVGDFRRRPAVVRLSGGEQIVAWTYYGRAGIVAGRRRIIGSWPTFSRGKLAAIGSWWQGVKNIRDVT